MGVVVSAAGLLCIATQYIMGFFLGLAAGIDVFYQTLLSYKLFMPLSAAAFAQ